MKVGLIGLGKMGCNLALNLMDHSHQVVGFDFSEAASKNASDQAVPVVSTLDELVSVLETPRIVWLMIPAGKPTQDMIDTLATKLDQGDTVIDGGNTNYEHSIAHAQLLQDKGIHFLDVGTSGGMRGARHGACLMIGGSKEAYQRIEPVFADVSCEGGLIYSGKAGSGHYLKMIHNGIEYGMMQAIGEGFEILEASQFDYDFSAVASVWNSGSVIESWLMELAASAFDEDPVLEQIAGKVDASGEGEWTVESALQLKVPAPVIALSVMMRYRSKQDDSFSSKVVAALRNKFGGHEVHRK